MQLAKLILIAITLVTSARGQQAASRADGTRSRGQAPCESPLVTRDGTVRYPESIVLLQQRYAQSPYDDEVKSRLSQALVEFARCVGEEPCVDRAIALAAALSLAEQAARIDDGNIEAWILTLDLKVAQIQMHAKRRGPAEQYVDVAIPIPRARITEVADRP